LTPDKEAKELWSGIWSREATHNNNAEWLSELKNKLASRTTREQQENMQVAV